MNSELIVKDVEFHGDMLRAAQDSDGKIWVGVSHMCSGIGFEKDRMKNEKKKIQNDVVLRDGVKFHPPSVIILEILLFYVLILTMYHYG